MLKRTNEFLLEDVDSNGRSKAESGAYSFTKAGSRINVLIKLAIGTDIDAVIKKFMVDATESLKTSIGLSISSHLNIINERIKRV